MFPNQSSAAENARCYSMITMNWTSDLFVFLGNILLPCLEKKWKQTKTSFWRKIQLANYQSMKQFAFCGSALENQSFYVYDAVYFIV